MILSNTFSNWNSFHFNWDSSCSSSFALSPFFLQPVAICWLIPQLYTNTQPFNQLFCWGVLKASSEWISRWAKRSPKLKQILWLLFIYNPKKEKNFFSVQRFSCLKFAFYLIIWIYWKRRMLILILILQWNYCSISC